MTELKTYVDPQGSERVGVTTNVADMKAVRGAMQTQAGADAIERDGIIPETVVILIESEEGQTSAGSDRPRAIRASLVP